MNSVQTIVNRARPVWNSGRIANKLVEVATAVTASDEQ